LTDGIVIEAEAMGKYKLILQAFAVFGLALHYRYLGIDFYLAGMYFLWIAAAVGIWSGVYYHVTFFRLLQSKAESRNRKRAFG
jgi:phosphatidylglycerophosphate synthase